MQGGTVGSLQVYTLMMTANKQYLYLTAELPRVVRQTRVSQPPSLCCALVHFSFPPFLLHNPTNTHAHTSHSRRWEKVRAMEPTNQNYYSAVATALFLAEDYEKCEQVLTTGLKLFPKNIHLLYNLGNLYLKTDRPELSLHYLKLTMELDPNFRNVKTLIEKKFKKFSTFNAKT